MVAAMSTITVKVGRELKERMKKVRINWSEYIRDAINRRIQLEERRRAAERLIEDLKAGGCTVPKGFINGSIRELRDAR